MNLFGGNTGQENLDRPLSNFDVIGIPTDRWSSHFCACHENMVPSCVVSFFCPCIMWGQIVVRAQIPMLIGIKNSFACLRGQSGYGLFVEYYFWSLAISIALILVLSLVTFQSRSLYYFLIVLVIGFLGSFLVLVGHSLTAFREKYRLPSFMLPGCTFWERISDVLLITVCFPCTLSRMARHVFQYDRMDTSIGLFLSDPYHLPPLRPLDEEAANGSTFERPLRADQAGLDSASGNAGRNRHTGAAHRQEAILAQQRQQVFYATAEAAPATSNPVAVASPVQTRRQ